MYTTRTQVMRFSRDRHADSERFAVRLFDGETRRHEEHHHATADRLRDWLITEHGYSGAEADDLIAQLRAHSQG